MDDGTQLSVHGTTLAVVRGGRNEVMPGKVQKAKGRAKEAIGRATGNRRLEREGKRDRIVGGARDKAHKVERAVERKVDEKLDELEDDRGRGRANG